ncbi:unnamed protein product [Vitrella brassicaformis CCMP3155]|uniref:Uncharacterized protein n=3 Tax=Vitrella brassicaformis TaxID=1169539 RepID=A0A0G4FFG0_VITBC|nr:unnamed protein product [Vitrella brassicaformis CCMP3155]|eukprot:CEM11942.1 unnamed protein product [Vitrella brassicaformis CCMP3155]
MAAHKTFLLVALCILVELLVTANGAHEQRTSAELSLVQLQEQLDRYQEAIDAFNRTTAAANNLALLAHNVLHHAQQILPQPLTHLSEYSDIFDAVLHGDDAAVNQLLEGDPTLIDKRDFYGRTPFLDAAEKGHVGVMKAIHESKSDVLQQTTDDKKNALHLAAYDGHVAAVDQLLEWNPKLIDAADKYDNTPLMGAAFGGHVEVMEVLYAKGGEELLKQTNNDNWTALHWAVWGAARHGNSAAVSQLLKWYPELLDIEDNDGKTPWDLAERYNEAEIGGIMANINKCQEIQFVG